MWSKPQRHEDVDQNLGPPNPLSTFVYPIIPSSFWRCLTCQWLAIQVAIAVCGACGNFFHQDTTVVAVDFGGSGGSSRWILLPRVMVGFPESWSDARNAAIKNGNQSAHITITSSKSSYPEYPSSNYHHNGHDHCRCEETWELEFLQNRCCPYCGSKDPGGECQGLCSVRLRPQQSMDF